MMSDITELRLNLNDYRHILTNTTTEDDVSWVLGLRGAFPNNPR